MKSQKRHELQTNELADHLGKYLKAIEPYQNLVLLGVVAAVVIVGGVMWMSNQRSAEASASWSDYFKALGERRAESLEEVAAIHDGSTAAWWSLQSAGDIKLATGSGMMYMDRDEAETNLKDAEKNFQRVEEGATKHPELVRRARFGLAQVYETMCDVPKAKDYYQQVAESDPNSVIGKLAERRLDELSEESTQKWYNWFKRQEPAPPALPEGTGLGPLGDLEDLPERPDLSFPSTGSPLDGLLLEDGASQDGPDLAPADQPEESSEAAEMAEEPAESPAAEAPAEEAPAVEETPAEKAPAAEETPTAEKAPAEPSSEPAPAEPVEPEPEEETQPEPAKPAAEEAPETESEAPVVPAEPE